jgi:hypothetical protein
MRIKIRVNPADRATLVQTLVLGWLSRPDALKTAPA